MLVVTHDLGLAWTIADRVAVMYLGRIVEIGPAEDVLTEPLHPYTKRPARRGARGGRHSTARILTGEPPDPTRSPRVPVPPRCPELVRAAAAAARRRSARCRGEDLGLVELRPDHFAACHLAAARHGDAVPSATT